MVLFGTSLWPVARPYSAVPQEGGAAASTEPASKVDAGYTEVPLPTAGLIDEASGALASVRVVFSSFLQLLTLEARRAGLALMWMVALGVVAAVCIVAAWLGLMAALAMWAVSLGLHPIAAVIAIAVFNTAGAAGLIFVCIGMSRDLLFSATRRQVAGNPPPKAAP